LEGNDIWKEWEGEENVCEIDEKGRKKEITSKTKRKKLDNIKTI
jgi:hypothetical protein